MPWWARRSDSSGRRDEPERLGRGGRRRRWPWVILALLLLSGLILQAQIRDLPRRMVEVRLGDALDAEVAVGKLHLRSYPRVVLENVTVRRAETLPWLRQAGFPEIVAQVHLRSLLAGRIDRLSIAGGPGGVGLPRDPAGNVELDARCDMALRLPETAAALEIGELSVGKLDLGVHRGGERTAAEASVDLRRSADAAGWTGAWELTAEEVDLEMVLVLLAGDRAPACGGSGGERSMIARGLLAEGEVLSVVDEGGIGPSRTAFRGTVRADQLALNVGGRSLVVPGPHGKLDWEAAVPRRLAAGFELGPLGRGDLSAELDGANGLFRALDGEVVALDLGILLPLAVADVTSAEGEAELSLRLGEGGVGEWEGTATLSVLDLRTAAGGADVRTVDLESSGRFDLDEGVAFLTMSGSAAAATLETAERWTVEAASVRLRGDGSLAIADAAPRLRPGATTIEIEARLEPWGDVEVAAAHDPGLPVDPFRGTWVWRGAEIAMLRDRLAKAGGGSWTGWTVEGRVDGAGSFSGPLREPTLRGRIEAHGLTVEGDELDASYRAQRASVELRRLPGGAIELRSSSTGEATLGGLPAIPIDVEADGSSRGGLLQLETGRVSLGNDGVLGRVVASGSGRPGSSWQGKLSAAEADVAAWYALWGAGPASSLLPGGRLGLELEWEFDEGRWSGEGGLRLEEGTLASADGSRVLAPLAWRWALSTSADAELLTARLSGDIGGFQMLWDAAFADYSGTRVPLVLELHGSRADGGASGWRLGGKVELDLGEEATAKGWLSRASAGRTEYGLEVRAAELGPVVEGLVRQPFAAGDEPLGRLTARGALDLSVAGERNGEGGAAQGALHASGVDLTLLDDVAVAGLDVELPLDLVWSSSEAGEPTRFRGPVRSGSLRFASFEAAGLVVPTTAARIEVEGETVRLVDRLSVPVLGGAAVLGGLRLSAGTSGDGAGPRLESAVELDGLDLARITEVFDLFRLEGRVDGMFPDVVVAGGELHTRGSGELEVFGGRASVEQVEVTELFSRFPRIKFGARFEGLDLGQITRTLEFGEITGRVRGELRAVELVGGSPVRFLGRVESVPVSGVKQRVSLKAANNLTLLGTGTSGALGGGLLPRLFDRFPYVGLGLELVLARDRFQLRGLLRRGDRELFLKGRLPVRLDIVNVRPGATVSFTTMMARLGNLEIGRPDEGGRSHEQRAGD